MPAVFRNGSPIIATMAALLPDPRCFAPPGSDPFVALALESVSDAMQRGGPPAGLVAAYRDALTRNDEEGIRASLRHATSAQVARRLWAALDRALQLPARAPDAPELRLFALPVLVVTGGREGVVVPGLVPDVSRVQQVLADAGALGPSQSFGLGNALCSLEALQSLALCRVHAMQADTGSGAASLPDLPPAPMHTPGSDEAVHLRFLVGAGIVVAGAPSFVETGAAIGQWGLRLTHELADQMRVDGLSVLPIPRPPASLLTAQASAVIACEELALQAFVSRVLRRFRSEVGEPQAALAALASGGLGLRLSSPFVENRISVHRRALHVTEDLDEALRAILALLRECGVGEVQVLPGILPDEMFARHPDAPTH